MTLASLPSQAQISNDVAKIGALIDMNGVFSDAVGAGSALAAKMAVEDFGGSVLGKPIAVVSADHQNKVDVGAAAREWFDIDAIFVLNTSSVALAVQQI
jgi:branched-chain amino acid transport system substrate-binding protein